MEVFEAVVARRSIRRYKSAPVEEEKLKRLLEAARLSPSVGNRQPWRFIVVRDPETKRKLADARWLPRRAVQQVEEAPVVLVGCGVPSESIRIGNVQQGYDIDVTIALQSVVLAATSMGLGTCWIGGFEEEKAKEILRVPKEVRIVSLLTLGYPDEAPGPKARKELSEIVYYDSYGK